MNYGNKSVQRTIANALANEDIPLEDSVAHIQWMEHHKVPLL